MTIETALWTVGPQPRLLPASMLGKEQLLEDMIVAAPDLLSNDWMLIGRQEDTGYGGRIDLLAMAPDASLVLIELKRDRTPRDVVAQALDYAGWVEGLEAEDLAAIYGRFKPGASLSADFASRFGIALDEESLNQSHQIVVVAAQLDASTERIINYLNARSVAINVLCFQVFESAGSQILSRSWLLDPLQTQPQAIQRNKPNEPWNGEFYCSFSPDRSWDDAVRYGFFSAGGGSWYTKTLQLLDVGDRIWVNIPGEGYVAVGRVAGTVQPAATFRINDGTTDASILDVATNKDLLRARADDPEKSEYFIAVQWLQTFPRDRAFKEVGLFGNQNSVCRPTAPKWRSTVERLKEVFPNHDQVGR